MAQCRKCKASVGCGCNLKDGLCTYCYEENKKFLIVNPPATTISKTVATPVDSTSLINQQSGASTVTLMGGFNLLM